MTKYSLFVDRDGYLLDVQADLLSDLTTRTVVPLIPQSGAPKAVKRLHPTFLIGGKSYVMLTHLIGTVSTAGLAESGISLAEQRGQVDAALDMLFEGF
jgi:toxin CcdB